MVSMVKGSPTSLVSRQMPAMHIRRSSLFVRSHLPLRSDSRLYVLCGGGLPLRPSRAVSLDSFCGVGWAENLRRIEVSLARLSGKDWRRLSDGVRFLGPLSQNQIVSFRQIPVAGWKNRQ